MYFFILPKDCPEFDLSFDNTVDQWVASSAGDKCTFIQVLHYSCQRYCSEKKPEFVNCQAKLLGGKAPWKCKAIIWALFLLKSGENAVTLQSKAHCCRTVLWACLNAIMHDDKQHLARMNMYAQFWYTAYCPCSAEVMSKRLFTIIYPFWPILHDKDDLPLQHIKTLLNHKFL